MAVSGTRSATVAAGDGNAKAPDTMARGGATGTPKSLRTAALRASFWTLAGFGASLFIRMANNVVLSYLLFPEAFGVMALINIFLQGLIMCSDIGVGPSIIQHERGNDPRFLNTAWTLQAIRGGLLCPVSLVLSWPLAWFYGEPELLRLLPVAALIPLLDGLSATAIYTVQRHMDVHRLTLLEIVSQVAGGGVMCLWAWLSPSVWALVVGTVAATGVRAVGSHFLLAPPRNGFGWDRQAARDIVGFGKWILIGTMVAFAALQIDRLILGRLVTMETLGLYSVGLAIAQMPYMILMRLAYYVQHPILSELERRSAEELRERIFGIRAIMLWIGAALTLAVFAAAPLFFQVVYHENFHHAGPLAQWLSLAMWAMILSESVTRVLLVKGDSRSLAIYNTVRVLATLGAAIAGYVLAGIHGFIAGVALGAVCGHVVLQVHMGWHKMPCHQQDVAFTVALVGLATVSELLRTTGDAWWPGWGQVAGLGIPLGVGVWALLQARQMISGRRG